MCSLVLKCRGKDDANNVCALADQLSVKWPFFLSKYGGPLSLDSVYKELELNIRARWTKR